MVNRKLKPGKQYTQLLLTLFNFKSTTMKNIVSILLILLVPALLGAQTMRVSKFYHTNKLKKNSFHVTIPGFLIRLGASIGQKHTQDEEGKMAFKMIKRIKWARVLIIEDNQRVKANRVNKMVAQLEQKTELENLVAIRDGQSRFNIMIREKNDRIKNLLVVAHDEGDFIMLYLKTKLSMDKLNKFLKSLDSYKGLDKLTKKIPSLGSEKL